MFNIITQRLLWKEFRAQQMVWIAIAGELVLLQLWWGIKGHEYADVNLFSMAFVLTGVFAMTTCALLFAGESEAKTDLFLRQLPITPRQLIGGKLLYGGLAVVVFLWFAVLSSLLAGQMAGKYGGDASSLMGDPSVFALSIVGLAAWGLFYSLVTRKVLWTVIGAALTEIILGGIVHSMILADYHLPEWVFYSIYTVIIAAVVAVDAWLLRRWCASEAISTPIVTPETDAAATALVPEASLPWLNVFRWSCFTGMVSGICVMLLLVIEVNIRERSSFSVKGEQAILGGGTLLGVLIAMSVLWLRSRTSAGDTPVAMTHTLNGYVRVPSLQRTGAMLGMCVLAPVAFVLGCVFTYATLGIFVSLLLIIPPSLLQPGVGYMLCLATFTAFSTGVAILWGAQWLRSALDHGTSGWLLAMQMIHAIPHRAARRLGPLLWIEVRRALPVLLVGWVLLALIGWYRWDMVDYAAFSYIAIVIAALVCGLLTLLPDRSHGTLAFLTERGVSSTKIILSKVFVWGGTLLIMLIPPLLQGRVWEMLDIPTLTPQIAHGLYATQGSPLINMVSAPSPARYLLVQLLGTFTIGVVAAAWVRRPILAGIVGFSLMLPWFGWGMMLMETYAPIGFTALVPIALIGLAILWTGSRTLLEQSSWRSKLGQIAWVLLVGFIGLQGYFHFRANEVPLVTHYEPLKSLSNGQPSPLSHPASSWMYPFDESIPHAAQLDALIDDETKKNALVQPPGFWGASHAFQQGIASLHLDEESCDLDAAFEHLRKWHELTEKLAYASRDEDGWVDALMGRRVVLSALRQWANHPKQSAERIETAMTKLTPNQFGMSGGTVIARQYADTRRSLETGISTDSIHHPGAYKASPVAQWLLARTGEKERVRRLIDYYFYLSAGTRVSQPISEGAEFDHWIGTTHASAATLGVSLPWQRLNVRHRGQFELAMSGESATRLVLQLQAWRLKHGSFPASFADVITELGPINARDWLTNEAFGYEPQGFDRDLQAETNILIPAKQPLLYSEGLSEPRGVWLAPLDPPGIPTKTLQYQALNFRSNQPLHMSNHVPPVIDRPANPHTIRFSVFGQITDEDSLYRLQRAGQTDVPDQGTEAAPGGAATMSSGIMIEGDLPAPPAHASPTPSPGTPEVP